MSAEHTPLIQAFFDEATNTVSYIVADPGAGRAAIIDPVLDYDPKSGKIQTTSADALLAAAQKSGLKIEWILETHAHADHLSAAVYLKEHTGAKTAIGAHIQDVQKLFKPIFNAPDISGTGAEFDRLLEDGAQIALGAFAIEVLHTPGHTPGCVSYKIEDAVFVGDTLFMPDYGTARTDFPGGDARVLYRSIRKLLSLPPRTRLFMCHDYKAPGRDDYRWETTVEEERTQNIHIHDGVDEEAYVAMRVARDKTLSAPVLLLPAVQVNIRGGHLPPAEDNGVHYLKIPVRLPRPLPKKVFRGFRIRSGLT